MVVGPISCPEFHPTQRDLNGSFEDYVERIEKSLEKHGIGKLIAPRHWTPREAGYENLELQIERPIRQVLTGRQGLYRMMCVEQKPMSLKHEFRPAAEHPDNKPPAEESQEELERNFWRTVAFTPPLYGADIPGSLWDKDAKGWNLQHLDTVLSKVLTQNGHFLPGVVTPYLYVGTWKSIFGWHTEDMDLYSVNYLHCGAPKTWYCIPPEHRPRFETLMQGMLPDLFRNCPEFFRHKELLVSPQFLQHHNIPFVKVTQRPREFIITYPGAYHAGFNQGYNIAESVNFATRRWIPIGANACACECKDDSVNIDMRLFRHLVGNKKALPQHLFDDSSSSEDDDSNSDGGGGSSSDDDGEGATTGDEASSSSCFSLEMRVRKGGRQGAGRGGKATSSPRRVQLPSPRGGAATAGRSPRGAVTPAAAARRRGGVTAAPPSSRLRPVAAASQSDSDGPAPPPSTHLMAMRSGSVKTTRPAVRNVAAVVTAAAAAAAGVRKTMKISAAAASPRPKKKVAAAAAAPAVVFKTSRGRVVKRRQPEA